MTETIFTRDAGITAFSDAGGAVSTDDDGVTFSWDEEHVVRVDAPADLEGAFDTNQFYKIEDATVARPIKQPYMVGDSVEWYKKPADELKQAAWTFDNSPFVLGHPDTGMVKDVNDIHGFWRGVHYDADEDRLRGDLYVPTADEEAMNFIEEHQDVSPGFYNRVLSEYDGDTGDLTDDDVDGFQADMYGDHIAGVKQGRCSGADGCGLEHDGSQHGEVVTLDASTNWHEQHDFTAEEMVEMEDHDREYLIAPPTTDYSEDGTYYAISPDETDGDNPKYPINNCSDVDDAWHLRGHGDYSVEQSTLESRIKERARELDCSVPGETTDNSPESTEDCGCSNMTDDNDFDLPDLSIDALADKNENVAELTEARDSLQETVDEMEQTIEAAFDEAEHFSVELDEDECPCEAVSDLVEDLDSKAEEVEDLRDELDEYRAEDINEKLDTLEDLGASRDEWEETADEADDPLEVLDEEIERREEVLESADANMSVKDVPEETNDSTDEDDTKTTYSGTRTFGRGHNA